MTEERTVKLVTLRVANPALQSDALPRRLKLLNWGDNPSTKGNIRISTASVAAIPVRQSALGYDRVALDFEHNTVPGTDEYERTQEPRPIAAHGVPVVFSGDGLYLDDLRWTAEGSAMAAGYPDLSPAVALNAAGEVEFIHSAALTRHGSVHDLTCFSVNLKPIPSPIMADTIAPGGAQPETITVAELAAALGLDAKATKADVLAKLTAIATPPAEMKPAMESEVTALSAKVVALETALAAAKPGDPTALTALSAKIVGLEGQLAAQRQAREETERAALITQASRDGQVIPLSADTLKTTPLATLKEIVSGLPKNVVPLSAKAKPAADGPPETSEAIWNRNRK